MPVSRLLGLSWLGWVSLFALLNSVQQCWPPASLWHPDCMDTYPPFPLPDQFDSQKASCFHLHIEVVRRVRRVRRGSFRDWVVLPNNMLFLRLQVGKGRCGVGQADEGGEVEVGDDNLQGQDWQRCQAHPQTTLSSWRLEQLCAIIQLHQLWHISSTTTPCTECTTQS